MLHILIKCTPYEGEAIVSVHVSQDRAEAHVPPGWLKSAGFQDGVIWEQPGSEGYPHYYIIEQHEVTP